MHPIQVNEDINLKPIVLSDAKIIFHIIQSQRAYLRKWLPFVDNTRHVVDTENYINSIYATPPDQRERVFTIHYKNAFAGLIGLKSIDKQNQKTEIGYWLSESFQKKGIMSLSVKALIDYAFQQLQLNRIQIKCAVGNNESKHIPQRLGFTFEGIEREGEFLSDNTFTDLEVYSILKKDLV
jgi:ribosomal-protein-serine acetyltransferase